MADKKRILAGATLIGGIHPVREALRTHPEEIREIILARDTHSPPVREILQIARSRQIKVKHLNREEFLKAFPETSQGIGAVRTSFPYTPFETLLASHPPGTPALLLALDSIKDPQNLGAIIRSAVAFGVSGLILPKDRTCPLTDTVYKASSGGLEHIRTVRVTNLVRALLTLKEEGFWVLGLVPERGKPMSSFSLPSRVVLVLGEEGQGIRPLVEKTCDLLLSIPMSGKIGSLNVSVAAGIALYEISARLKA